MQFNEEVNVTIVRAFSRWAVYALRALDSHHCLCGDGQP